MQKNTIKKGLVFAVILLFIGVSYSSAIPIETNTSVISNQSEENKSNVDLDIHLKRINLPLLKRSLNYFRNSDYYDVEIGKVMEQIINLIDFKGEVNNTDVENILINNKISSIDVYTKCNISGISNPGYAFTIPFLLPEIFFFLIRWWIPIFIGIGGFLKWVAFSGTPITDIEITVGLTNYTSPHKGYAFGFFGIGHVWQGTGIPEEGPFWLSINGRASIVFIRT